MLCLDEHGQRSVLGSDCAPQQLGALATGRLPWNLPNIFWFSTWLHGCLRAGVNDFSLSDKCHLPFFFPDEYALAEYKTPCSQPSNWNQIRAWRADVPEGIRQTFAEEEEDERLGYFWKDNEKHTEEWRISKPHVAIDQNDLFWPTLQKAWGQCESETPDKVLFLAREIWCNSLLTLTIRLFGTSRQEGALCKVKLLKWVFLATDSS